MNRIVWLNGAFGVGKTTVARELVDLLPGARIIDPEKIGFVMRRTLWRGRDYQEVSLWRRLSRAWIATSARRRQVIVPMTVVDPEVLADLTRDLPVTSFVLTASRAELIERIRASGEAVGWREENLDRCLAAFAGDGLGDTIGTDGKPPAEVAAEIAERLRADDPVAP